MKALVTCYSRTGTTLKVANEIARALGCDMEQIITRDDPGKGVIGFLTAGMNSILNAGVKVRRLEHDPESHGLVVIGTPVWAGRMSNPVRKILDVFHGKLSKVAFFSTYGMACPASLFDEMACKVGKEPIDTLALHVDEVNSGRGSEKIMAFVDTLKRA